MVSPVAKGVQVMRGMVAVVVAVTVALVSVSIDALCGGGEWKDLRVRRSE